MADAPQSPGMGEESFRLMRAITYAQAAEWWSPRGGPARRLLAVAHHRRGDAISAMQIYRDALERMPGDAVVALKLGEVYYDQGQGGAALELWRTARGDAYFARAAVGHAAAERWAQAARLFDIALEINPTLEVPPHDAVFVATAYQKVGRNRKAEAILTAAAQAASQHPRSAALIQGNLGEFYLREGEVERAIYWLRRAVQADPVLIGWRLHLGAAYASAKQFRAGEAALYDALALSDRSASRAAVYGQLGHLYSAECGWPDAAVAYERALQLSPRDSEYQLSLGRTYRLLGHSSAAIALLERARESSILHVSSAARLELNLLKSGSASEPSSHC